MGNGMLLVTDQDQVADVVASLRNSGYRAQVAGRITAESGVTRHVSAGELRYAE